MVQQQDSGKVVSAGFRPIRDIGDSYGCSFDIDGLRELGIVDDDGELVKEVNGHQVLHDDGQIVIDLDLKD